MTVLDFVWIGLQSFKDQGVFLYVWRYEIVKVLHLFMSEREKKLDLEQERLSG
jgi:hypothetical protein